MMAPCSAIAIKSVIVIILSPKTIWIKNVDIRVDIRKIP
jgi:hypothetical protein